MDGTDVAARAWGRLRRPAGLVAQTRGLFCLCVLLILVVALADPVVGSTRATAAVLLVAAGALALVWVYRNVSGSAPLLLDLVEAAAVTAIGCGGAGAAAVFTSSSPPCGSGRCSARRDGSCSSAPV